MFIINVGKLVVVVVVVVVIVVHHHAAICSFSALFSLLLLLFELMFETVKQPVEVVNLKQIKAANLTYSAALLIIAAT